MSPMLISVVVDLWVLLGILLPENVEAKSLIGSAQWISFLALRLACFKKYVDFFVQ